MYILDACNNSSILNTILFIKTLIKIIFIVAPIFLVLLLTIDLAKNVLSKDERENQKNINLAIKRMVYCLALFFVPLLINAVMSFLDNYNVNFATCYEKATEVNVEKLYKEEEERYEQDREKKRQEREANKEKINQEKQEQESTSKTALQRAKQKYAEKAKAKQQNSTSSTSSTLDLSGVSSSAEKIAKTAEYLAYPSGTSTSVYKHNYAKSKKFSKWSDLNKQKPTDNFMKACDAAWSNHWSSGCSSTYGCWPAIGASCDRFVSVTVRYSGYDKSFPTGLASQITYLSSSSKWKKVSSASRGDVCIKSSHIKIYLGNGKIAEAGYKTKRFGKIYTSGNCSGYKIYRAAK